MCKNPYLTERCRTYFPQNQVFILVMKRAFGPNYKNHRSKTVPFFLQAVSESGAECLLLAEHSWVLDATEGSALVTPAESSAPPAAQGLLGAQLYRHSSGKTTMSAQPLCVKVLRKWRARESLARCRLIWEKLLEQSQALKEELKRQ